MGERQQPEGNPDSHEERWAPLHGHPSGRPERSGNGRWENFESEGYWVGLGCGQLAAIGCAVLFIGFVALAAYIGYRIQHSGVLELPPCFPVDCDFNPRATADPNLIRPTPRLTPTTSTPTPTLTPTPWPTPPTPTPTATATLAPEERPPADTEFLGISTSQSHGCGVTITGVLRCWGENGYRQSSPPDTAFVSVSAGPDRTCALSGLLVCWGRPWTGVAPPTDQQFDAISVGHEYACGVTGDGLVDCWGRTPPGVWKATTGKAYTSVSVGDGSGCALREDGTADCWGYGDLGGPPEVRLSSISAGALHSCGISTANRNAFCWGSNEKGQSSPPVGVAFQSISAGESRTCGIVGDGSILCWGGEPDEPAPPDGRFTSVSAEYPCAIREDRTLVCW